MLERKILRYSQNRKGPKKVGLIGIFQPLSDAIKLLIKNFGSLSNVGFFDFFFFPLWRLVMMIFFWLILSLQFSYFSIFLSLILLIVFLRLNVFPVLGSGWRSKRKYAFLGAVRGAAQRISYEVALVFLLIWIVFYFNVLNFSTNFNLFLGVVFPIILFFWLIIIVCETNRAPVDFAEGERELVSGFKVEYGSFPFALLFLAEYGVILFLSVLTAFLFFSKKFLILIRSFMITFCFLWFRTSFPRFRYDFLMEFCWGIILPLTFVILLIVFLF